jgi:hypothetical protein
MLARAFKLRCMKCNSEHFVEASKPGLLLFVCPSCGAHHALVLDSNLDLRDFRVVEEVEAMPAGVYEVVDSELMPSTLRALLSRATLHISPEDAARVISVARRLGLLRVVAG